MIKDLIILAPDKNTKFVLEGLLPRKQALGIRNITFDIFQHPERDPGVYHKSASFLAQYFQDYNYAIIFLDKEGSGQENKSAVQLAAEIKNKNENFGWQGRIEVIVFDPELEIWAWVQSPILPHSLGWNDLSVLRTFIEYNGFWRENLPKPDRPKEAIEFALREKRIPRSSSIYKAIAEKSSFRECQDPAFLLFKITLQNWFPEGE